MGRAPLAEPGRARGRASSWVTAASRKSVGKVLAEFGEVRRHEREAVAGGDGEVRDLDAEADRVGGLDRVDRVVEVIVAQDLDVDVEAEEPRHVRHEDVRLRVHGDRIGEEWLDAEDVARRQRRVDLVDADEERGVTDVHADPAFVGLPQVVDEMDGEVPLPDRRDRRIPADEHRRRLPGGRKLAAERERQRHADRGTGVVLAELGGHALDRDGRPGESVVGDGTELEVGVVADDGLDIAGRRRRDARGAAEHRRGDVHADDAGGGLAEVVDERVGEGPRADRGERRRPREDGRRRLAALRQGRRGRPRNRHRLRIAAEPRIESRGDVLDRHRRVRAAVVGDRADFHDAGRHAGP